MKAIQTNELRELQMQILDYVDAFCRKNDIKYTISGGTLLGAVRHGGYIPWDDDMDIQMLRNEYIRFAELWNHEKNHGYYELINIESGNSMGYPFGKVHDARTVSFIGKLERTGVYIDVFPVDNVKDEDDFVERHAMVKKLIRSRAHRFDWMRVKADPFDMKRWLLVLKNGIPCKTYEQIAEEINGIAQKFNNVDTSLVYEMVSGMRCKRPMPAEVFREYTDINFENRQYLAVKNYDTYLTQTFGDYMTPPPVKEREPHQFQAYWR